MRRRAELRVALEQTWHDLRQAGRGLWRAPAFTTAAVLTLALGIARHHGDVRARRRACCCARCRCATSGAAARRLEGDPAAGVAHWPFARRDVDVIGRESRRSRASPASATTAPVPGVVFENGFASYLQRRVGRPATFFDVLGVRPVLGARSRAADDVAGAENVLVITHAPLAAPLRRRARRRSGAGCRSAHQPFTIVGVMPPDVEYPRGVEAWMTLAANASIDGEPGLPRGRAARRRPRRPPAAGRDARAGAERARGLVTRLEAEALPGRPCAACGRSSARTTDVVVGDVRPAMLVLFGAVGARAADRERERRQPAAAARRGEAARAGGARGARRRPRPAGAPAARREPAARPRRRRRSASPPAGVLLRPCVALVPGGLPRVESVRIDAAWSLFTPRGGVPRRRARRARPGAVRWRAPTSRRSCAPADARGRPARRGAARPARAGRGAGRARGHDRGGGGPADAQPAAAPGASRWAWPRTGWCSCELALPPGELRRPRDAHLQFLDASRGAARGGARHRGGDAGQHAAVRRHRRLGRCRCSPPRARALEQRRGEPGAQPGGVHPNYFATVRRCRSLRGRAFTARRSARRARGRDRQRGSSPRAPGPARTRSASASEVRPASTRRSAGARSSGVVRPHALSRAGRSRGRRCTCRRSSSSSRRRCWCVRTASPLPRSWPSSARAARRAPSNPACR